MSLEIVDVGFGLLAVPLRDTPTNPGNKQEGIPQLMAGLGMKFLVGNGPVQRPHPSQSIGLCGGVHITKIAQHCFWENQRSLRLTADMFDLANAMNLVGTEINSAKGSSQ